MCIIEYNNLQLNESQAMKVVKLASIHNGKFYSPFYRSMLKQNFNTTSVDTANYCHAFPFAITEDSLLFFKQNMGIFDDCLILVGKMWGDVRIGVHSDTYVANLAANNMCFYDIRNGKITHEMEYCHNEVIKDNLDCFFKKD